MTPPLSPEPTQKAGRPLPVEPVGLPPLAQRLVRTLCLVGFAVAIGSVLQTLRPYLIMAFAGLPVRSALSRFDETYQWLALGTGALALASDGLLIAGLAGEWLARPWSRRLLNLYFWLWAESCALGLATQFTYQHYLSTQYTVNRTFWWWDALADAVASLLTELAYPALLLICLGWPEVRRAQRPDRAFAPILR